MEKVNLKAEVKEEKGEISMSVDETNRVRALLGLKPLAIKKEGGTTEEKVIDIRGKNAREREQSEITERIERARVNRKRKEKLAGPIALSVAEEGEEDVLSAESWVKSSKKRMSAAAQQRDAAERSSRSSSAVHSASYQESDLKGLAVVHDSDKFEAGKEVVLTLQDDEVLERDIHGVAKSVAEGKDKLENVKLSEDAHRLNAERSSKRAKRGAYVGYDDDEFVADAEVGPGAQHGILSHYDEDENARKFSDKGLIIGGKQEVTATTTASRPKFDADVLSKSARGGGLVSASEYYTEEEMAKFKKPKKMRKKKVCRRKREEVTAEEVSEEGGEEVRGGGTAAALEAVLASAGKAETKVDHGSRNDRGSTSLPDTEEIKKARFESAVAKASEAASKALMPPPSKQQQPKLEVTIERSSEEEEERQVKLQLARSRQIADRAASNEGHVKDDVGESVAVRVLSSVKAEAAESAASSELHDNSVNGGQTEGKGVVFTSTTEFTSRLKAVLTERARDRDLSKQREVARAEREAAEQLEKDLEAQREMNAKEEPTVAMNVTAAGAENGNEHGLEYMHRQPLARSSLSAAMDLLQQSGDIGRSNAQETTGRAKDETVGISNEGVKLEYRDEYGRALTQKEAFRQLNYKFHGFGPGKKKQEKRLKQLEDEYERTKARERGEFAVQNQERMQEAMNQAYVVVSGPKGTGNGGDAGRSILDLKKAKAKKRKESSSSRNSSRKR